MGKASGRKRERHRDGDHDRVQIAGSVPAPNFEGVIVETTRYALAMVTSVHASPEDLPGLIEELAPDRARQGLVAYALLAELISESACEFAEVLGTTVAVAVALTDVVEDYEAESVNQPALDRALATVRKHAEVLDGMRSPEAVVADLDANLVQRQAAPSYLIALTQIAHDVIAARCAEIGEDVVSYLRRISLSAAETHGNEIEAAAVEDYIDALMAERLTAEPLLLTRAAGALRYDFAALPDEDIDEFHELGGSGRLEELADETWDGMDAEDKRLVAITLLESVLVDPEGETVADRLRVAWRF
jgi:hypothetical protein